jgi:hypothetical protein
MFSLLPLCNKINQFYANLLLDLNVLCQKDSAKKKVKSHLRKNTTDLQRSSVFTALSQVLDVIVDVCSAEDTIYGMKESRTLWR